MDKSKGSGIVMIGAGNVATCLAVILKNAGHAIDLVYSRTPARARKLASRVDAGWTCDISKIDNGSGIKIFALTDQAILDSVEKLGCYHALMVHTAGSLPMNIFAGHSDKYGVLYPLQTMSSSRETALHEFPLCIEANSKPALAELHSLALTVSSLVYNVNSEMRQLLHLAAVFSCNFSNHMYTIAESIANRAGVPFDILHPLIRETAEKAIVEGPVKSQTGPAARNDSIIIKKHLELLSCSPGFRSIYEKLSESISKMDRLRN